jgi:hypothetical protein
LTGDGSINGQFQLHQNVVVAEGVRGEGHGEGNREQGTGNREQGMGNREQGMGNRQEARGGMGNRVFLILSVWLFVVGWVDGVWHNGDRDLLRER